MKIHGETLNRSNEEVVVLPRSGGNDIVFKLKSIQKLEEFDTQFPAPTPPSIMRKGQTVATPDLEDKKYQKAVFEQGRLKSKWMLLKSLDATEGIEWEKVKVSEPATWDLLEEELKDSGLNEVEIMRLYQAMMKVNSLDEEYLEEARERFFASVQAQAVAEGK